MNAPNVRSATVRLNAEVAKYVADMRMAGKVTDDAFAKIHARTQLVARDSAAAQKSVQGLARSALTLDKRMLSVSSSMDKVAAATRGTSLGIQTVDRGTVRLGTSMQRTGNLVDRTSGRLRLLGEALLTLGPGLIPLGAVTTVGLGGLAGLFTSATIGALGLAAATQGVGEAFKAVEKARLEPTIANLQDAEELMGRLAPETQDFVTRLQETVPVMREIRDSGASQFFPGLTKSIDDFERLEPVLSRFMSQVGRAGGREIANIADSLDSRRWRPFLSFLADEAPDAIRSVSNLVGDLAHGAAQLWMAFDPGNDAFIDWALGVGEAFDKWASSQEGRDDVAAFLAYAEENGPKAADAFVAIVDALTQIVQAAAPLGGPTLEILTGLADAAAAVANSDIATPLLAGVAAYSALNRVMLIHQGLQAKLSGTAAAGARGGLFGAVTTGAGSARTAVRNLRTDLAVLGPSYAAVATRSERLSTASRSLARNLGGVAKTAALFGGLTVAATGAADGIGLTNTVSLGLLGTLGGPLGIAVGTLTGLLLDTKAGAEDTATALSAVDTVLNSGDTSLMEEQLASLEDHYDKLTSDSEELQRAFGNVLGSSTMGLFGDTASESIDKYRGEISATAEAIEALKYQMDFKPKFLSPRDLHAQKEALVDLAYGGLGRISDEAADAIRWLDALTNSFKRLLGFFSRSDALVAYQEALANARKTIRDVGQEWDASTKAGRANRTAMSQVATATAQYAEKLKGAAKINFLKDARRDFIALADAAGVPKPLIDRLADSIIDLDRKRARPKVKPEGVEAAEGSFGDLIDKAGELDRQRPKPKVSLLGIDATTGALAGALRLLTQVDGFHAKSTITTEIRTVRVGNDTAGGPPALRPGSADGTTVPKTGRPYADRHVYLLADGEEVVSNRYGQADRHRPRLKAINANRLADGGTTGPMLPTYTRSRSDNEVEREQRRTAQGLKNLTGRLKEAEKAVDRERRQRAALVDRMKQVSSGISTSLTSELGASGGGSPWSSVGGGTLAGNLAIVQGDTRDARRFGRLVDILKEKGFDGPALEDLLARGDINEISSYASATRGQLRQFEQAFNERAHLVQRVGREGADAALGKRLDAANDELREANRELRQIKAHVKQGNKDRKAEHGKDRESQRHAVGNGARNRRRDPL